MIYQQHHYRDCQAWKDDNLVMSTTSNEAAKLFDHAIHQMLAHNPDDTMGGIPGTINKMLEADQNFAMAKIMSIGMRDESCRNNACIAEAVAEIVNIEETSLNPRERLHRKAAVEWATERKSDACHTWEKILLHYPQDTMALMFSFNGQLFSGQVRLMRDTVAGVLPWWKPSDRYYGILQGFYAFGLEETHMYDAGEKAAEISLNINPGSYWAIHAYSHILEATGRLQKGIEFLDGKQDILTKQNTLSCHLHWHQALNYIELGNFERALIIYDGLICPMFKESGSAFAIGDGCQVLQRLEFEGLDVGGRWEDVYNAYKPLLHKHQSLFVDAHIEVAESRSNTGRVNKQSPFRESLQRYASKTTTASTTNGEITQRFGLKLMNGIEAFTDGNYEKASDWLAPIYGDLWEMGGSLATRDLFQQFVINACQRSSQEDHRSIARSLLQERKLFKETQII